MFSINPKKSLNNFVFSLLAIFLAFLHCSEVACFAEQGCAIDLNISTRGYDPNAISQEGIESSIELATNYTIVVGVVAQNAVDLNAYNVVIEFNEDELEYVKAYQDYEVIKNYLKKNNPIMTIWNPNLLSEGRLQLSNQIFRQDNQSEIVVSGSGLIGFVEFKKLTDAEDVKIELINVKFLKYIEGQISDENIDITKLSNAVINPSGCISGKSDFNQDGIVDNLDLDQFKSHWMLKENDNEWAPEINLDLTADTESGQQIINYLDLDYFGRDWQKTCQ